MSDTEPMDPGTTETQFTVKITITDAEGNAVVDVHLLTPTASAAKDMEGKLNGLADTALDAFGVYIASNTEA